MKKQRNDPILTQEPNLSKKKGMKIYHTPLLTEWGNLQGLTMGPANSNQDSINSGTAVARPEFEGPIPPWLLP